MTLVNYAKKEITCKLVYYGAGRSGKTTNLQYIYSKVSAKKRGEMTSLATETDRTLFFDFLPMEVGKIGNFTTKFQLYTVPGQIYYDATRKLVLQGADGVVFVVDSQMERLEDNIESFENFVINLEKNGLNIQTIPLVIQFNKRDLPQAIDIDDFVDAMGIDKERWPCIESVATKGNGVIDTLKKIMHLTLESIAQKLNRKNE